VEFAINNKAYLTTKVSLFMANYGRELRMGIDIRRRGKMNVQKEVGAALKRIMLSMKDLVFKERLARKLVDCYVGTYIIDKVVSTNAVKL